MVHIGTTKTLQKDILTKWKRRELMKIQPQVFKMKRWFKVFFPRRATWKSVSPNPTHRMLSSGLNFNRASHRSTKLHFCRNTEWEVAVTDSRNSYFIRVLIPRKDSKTEENPRIESTNSIVGKWIDEFEGEMLTISSVESIPTEPQEQKRTTHCQKGRLWGMAVS